MIGVAVVDEGVDALDPGRDGLFFQLQLPPGAVQARGVGVAVGIVRLPVAGAARQLQQRARVRRPAQRRIAAPAPPGRMHPQARAVFVRLALRTRGAHAPIPLRMACQHFGHLVIAPEAACQRRAVKADAGLLENGPAPLELHHACRHARAVRHALRPLDERDLLVGIRVDVRQRRIHALPAAAVQLHAIGQDAQPRARHAAQHRLRIAAALAQRRKARHARQKARRIGALQRLPGRARFNLRLQSRRLAPALHHHRGQLRRGFFLIRRAFAHRAPFFSPRRLKALNEQRQ